MIGIKGKEFELAKEIIEVDVEVTETKKRRMNGYDDVWRHDDILWSR